MGSVIVIFDVLAKAGLKIDPLQLLMDPIALKRGLSSVKFIGAPMLSVDDPHGSVPPMVLVHGETQAELPSGTVIPIGSLLLRSGYGSSVTMNCLDKECEVHGKGKINSGNFGDSSMN